MNKLLCSLLCVGLLAGCGDDDSTTLDAGTDAMVADAPETPDANTDTGPMPDGGSDAGTDAGPSACEAAESVLDPLSGTPRFAVLGSDYTSTSIAILDDAGDVLDDAWLDSGTTAPGLVAALGGDVVLPGQAPGTLTVLDRFGADVVSRFCFNGNLLGQVRLGPGEGFSANPHDVGMFEGGATAWATRHERNADRDAADLGNDLIEFDPTALTRLEGRVAFDEFDAVVTGRTTEGADVDVQIRARPSGIAAAGGRLVVGLSLLPENLFGDDRGHGAGAVAVVDIAGTIERVDLAPLADCGVVLPVPGTLDEVIVACNGYSDAGFGEETGTRATAGLVRLRVGAEGTTEVDRWDAESDEFSALSTWSPIPLGGPFVLAIALPDFASTFVDELYLVNVATGTQTLAFEADGAFVLGQGALAGTLVLLPDATEDAATVHRLTWDGSTLTETASVDVGPASLPPRSVIALQ